MSSQHTSKDFMIFLIGNQEYAIDLLSIQEILEYQNTIIHAVHAPIFIKGVTCVNGVIIPILDLKNFLYPSASGTEMPNVILVIKLTKFTLGIVVDSVPNIIDVLSKNIIFSKSKPELFKEKKQYIDGIFKIEDREVFILNSEKMIEEQYCSFSNLLGKNLMQSTLGGTEK